MPLTSRNGARTALRRHVLEQRGAGGARPHSGNALHYAQLDSGIGGTAFPATMLGAAGRLPRGRRDGTARPEPAAYPYRPRAGPASAWNPAGRLAGRLRVDGGRIALLVVPGADLAEIYHRPGRDLTFSASKSVSLAALVGGGARIVEAHDRAVGRAFGWFERSVAQPRDGSDPPRQPQAVPLHRAPRRTSPAPRHNRQGDMSGAFLRRRDRTDRPLRVGHYSSAVNSTKLRKNF